MDIIPENIKSDKSKLIELMVDIVKYKFKKSSDSSIIKIMQSKKFNES